MPDPTNAGGDPACWAHLADDAEAMPLPAGAVVADLAHLPPDGTGAIWSLPHGGQLDANLVRLASHGAIGEHVNEAVDVLMYGQSGSGVVVVGDAQVALAADQVVFIPRGLRRSVTAGPVGVTYLSVHQRRDTLSIGPKTSDPKTTEQPVLRYDAG